jgi:hypothetical protein
MKVVIIMSALLQRASAALLVPPSERAIKIFEQLYPEEGCASLPPGTLSILAIHAFMSTRG